MSILQKHGDTKQGIAYFVDTLSEGEFNQDELDDIAERIDFTGNRLRSVFMEFMRGERSVDDEDDLDDDAGECAFEIGEAVERGDPWENDMSVEIQYIFAHRVREVQHRGAHLRPPRLAPGSTSRATPEGYLQVKRSGGWAVRLNSAKFS